MHQTLWLLVLVLVLVCFYIMFNDASVRNNILGVVVIIIVTIIVVIIVCYFCDCKKCQCKTFGVNNDVRQKVSDY